MRGDHSVDPAQFIVFRVIVVVLEDYFYKDGSWI